MGWWSGFGIYWRDDDLSESAKSSMQPAEKRNRLLALLGLIAVVIAAYFLWARPYQLRWGATDQEVKQTMPGDELAAGMRNPKSESPKSERNPKAEIRRGFRSGHELKCRAYFRHIAPKIRLNSLASRHNFRAFSARDGSDFATMRKKNMVSFDSFRQVPIFCLNSLPDTESSASQ